MRSHFTKLRNTVRSFIQRAHRRAGGRSAPAAAHATGQVQIACWQHCAAILLAHEAAAGMKVSLERLWFCPSRVLVTPAAHQRVFVSCSPVRAWVQRALRLLAHHQASTRPRSRTYRASPPLRASPASARPRLQQPQQQQLAPAMTP